MSDIGTEKDAAVDAIRAVDAEGREVLVPRKVWAEEVIPGLVKAGWESPEELYKVVAISLNEGFVAEVTEAAARLYEIDPNLVRGTCVWAQTLILQERLVEAEMVLAGYLDRHGENGFVLANMAGLYEAKGESARAHATLERVKQMEAAAGQMQIGMVRVDGAVWLPAGSPVDGLSQQKPEGAPTVTFLGGSAEMPEGMERPSAALDGVSRSVTLFLAEQTQMRTAAEGRAMLPWAAGVAGVRPGGFVVRASRWPDEAAVQAAQGPNSSEYMVTVHVDAEVEPWEASLVFIRTRDGARIGELSAEFGPDSPQDGLPGLADEMVELLSALGRAETSAAEYRVPADLRAYLEALEGLLALRCAGMDGAGLGNREEREMIRKGLDLCWSDPASVPARLLLGETVRGVERGRPEIAAEFAGELERLQGGAGRTA